MLRTLVIFMALSGIAYAQEPKLTLGWTTFLDEDPIDHLVAGGSMRFYVTPRMGIEPEFLYMRGPRQDRDITFIPHFTYDFGNSLRRVPYVTGGMGVMRHTDMVGTGKYTNTEWTVSGGVGMKFFLTEKVFIAPEFRMGFEPILRATASIGFVF